MKGLGAKIITSDWFQVSLTVGLSIILMLSIGIFQGLSDINTLSIYPVDIAPFIVLFGLNKIGTSPLILSILFLIIAGNLSFKEINWYYMLGCILSFTLLVLSGMEQPSNETSESKILVTLTDTPDGISSAVIEQGEIYEVPKKDDEQRRLLFGHTKAGPYAIEKLSSGKVIAHLPSGNNNNSDVYVNARRPPVTPNQVSPNHALSQIMAFASCIISGLILILIPLSKPPERWLGVSFIFFVLLFFVMPLIRQDTGVFHIQSDGEPVTITMTVFTTKDLGPFKSEVLAAIYPSFLEVTAIMIFLFMTVCLGLMFLLRSRKSNSEILAFISGAVILVFSAFILLNGFIVNTQISHDVILHYFEEEILPYIPMDQVVLTYGMSTEESLTFNTYELFTKTLSGVSSGLALVILAKKEKKQISFGLLQGLMVILYVFTFAKAIFYLLNVTEGQHPATLPLTLIGCILGYVILLKPKEKWRQQDYFMLLVSIGLVIQ